MFQLWMQCQRDFDLTPFDLQIESSSSSACESTAVQTAQIPERRLSKDSQRSHGSELVSPPLSLSLSEGEDFEEPTQGGKKSAKNRQKSRTISRNSDTRPGVARTTSSEASKKRPSLTASTGRSKARPSVGRKRSSQTTQPSDAPKPRKSIIKSPRSPTHDNEKSENIPKTQTAILAQMTASPTTAAELASRKISVFELPSASSWQSVESHDHRPATNTGMLSNTGADPPLVDKDFRGKFIETQKQLHSSTNLAGMNKTMKKTGSVVRFADDVEEVRRLKKTDKQNLENSPLSNSRPGPLSRSQAASASQQGELGQGFTDPWQSQGLNRHNSIGSVAAVSDDSDDGLEDGIAMQLPRVRSQLSLGIANLKRSQSIGGDEQDDDENAVTSPQIEQEQEALISGRSTKKKTEEEEKLLAMGRKDGVTKAGGVNLPNELRVRGPRNSNDRFEKPEEILF